MTTDTSRDAVEALGLALHVLGDQAEIADNGPSDFATTQHTAADTLAALLDERDRLAANRDAWVSDAMTSTTELEQRIRDLETDTQAQALTIRAVTRRAERAEAECDKLTAELADETKRADENYDDVHKWRSKARKLAAKLDAVKERAVTDAMVEAAYQAMPRADHVYGVSYAGVRAALKAAILADTDETGEKP